MRSMNAVRAMLAAAAIAQGAAAHAQTASDAPVPEYRIEIILFAYRDVDRSEERFEHGFTPPEPPAVGDEPIEPRVYDSTSLKLESLLDDEPIADGGGAAFDAPAGGAFDAFDAFDTPDPSNTLDRTDGALDPTGNPTAAEADPTAAFGFRLLAPEELELGAQYRTLSRLGAYVPIAHAGWVQQGLPESAATPFDLAYLGVVNPRGTIRLRLSRFLHLDVDLTYQGRMPYAAAAQPTFGDRELAELEFAPRYTIHAERQTRAGELHYFDHPAFGLLVVVKPAPAPEAPAVAVPPEPTA